MSDPYAPIQGISLERYAELGAELDGITDEQAQIAKVAQLGVSAADWTAAKNGWTARMQDMSLMGAVATKYMGLYNQALAKKTGVAKVSFEDWCAMSAAIAVFGYEAAMKHFGVTQGEWTTISAHWQSELSRDPMNLAMKRNTLQEQETQRLRAGGQPKAVVVERGPAGAAVAGGAAAFDPNAHAAMQMNAAAQHNQQYFAQAAAVMNQGAVQAAVKMASGMAQLGGGSGLIVGAAVKVQWSDGNKYPGTIMQIAQGQSQIVFSDGRTMWIANQYLSV
ncbi:hypothetical protein [Sandaracinus amylolyticus]|uniref:Uncharacterized protein n=1 Tax=Sandaracinus amylolyticus TaxID=927083 RepID=A0A0F6W978_9BACT|nr:hypothetical protein [Sandaracinus amylolyticus]AKF10558.1 hypothetical protein DB32_007707 [Sandaracinus amylolyticus]